MSPEQGSGADRRRALRSLRVRADPVRDARRPAAARTKTAEERIAAMKQRFEEGLPPLRAIDESIPEPLEALVTRCLERDPAARYQTTAELCARAGRARRRRRADPDARAHQQAGAARRASSSCWCCSAGMYVVGRRFAPAAPPQHEPVSVVIADFQNSTGDPAFDRTLEPMLKLALEGAGFISAYDRTGISAQPRRAPAREAGRARGAGARGQAGPGRRPVRFAGPSRQRLRRVGQGDAGGDRQRDHQRQEQGVRTRSRSSARRRSWRTPCARRSATTRRTPTSGSRWTRCRRRRWRSCASTRRRRRRCPAAGSRKRGRSFSKAVELDPNFGLGYAGMAIASRNLDRQQDAEKYIKEAVRHLDGMTERERYRTRGLVLLHHQRLSACVKEYGDLIARYAADASARNNLALCLTYLREHAEGGRRDAAGRQDPAQARALPREPGAVRRLQRRLRRTAEQEARAIQEPGMFGLLAAGVRPARCRARWPRPPQPTRRSGRSTRSARPIAASGLGDLALYEGRFADAARILARRRRRRPGDQGPRPGGEQVRRAGVTRSCSRQQKARGDRRRREGAGEQQGGEDRFLAARVFVEAGAAAQSASADRRPSRPSSRPSRRPTRRSSRAKPR